MSLIKVEGLWYKYPLAQSSTLRDVNMQVDKGEFLVLLGPSGCGKSTLALTLNGVIPHEISGNIKGKVEVCGMNTYDHEVKDFARKVGIVFQNPDAQIIHLRVSDEVIFPMQNLLAAPAMMAQRLDEALEIVGLSKQKNSLVHNLSGGQKQRLAIASALIMKPDVLILDEPTVHLDPKGTSEVIETVVQMNRERSMTIIYIEHTLDDVIHLADRIAVMNEGTIVEVGNPKQLLHKRAEYIMHDLGLFIPQVTEAALFASKKGYEFANSPLTVEEFPRDIKLRQFGNSIKELPKTSDAKDSTSETIVEIKDVSFSYPNGFKALTDISLTIDKGETVTLVGSNGSGKTTLAKILIGLLKPTAGKVTIRTDHEEYDVSKTSPKILCKSIGYAFQNPEHQFVTENVFDEVAFGLQSQGLSAQEVERRTMTMLERFGLEKFCDKHPMSLSMGQKRRLSIATMLILEPRMIIFDEPMTGQDKRRTDYIIDLINTLKSQGTTSIFITHDMNFVANISTRVVVLNEGRLLSQGTPEKLFNSPRILHEASLSDPMIHRLALRFGEEFSSIIRVKDFCSLMEMRT